MADERWNMISFEHGVVAVVASNDHIIRICFKCSVDEVYSAIKNFYPRAKKASTMLIQDGLKQLAEYFRNDRRTFTVPLANDSLTPFARRIQRELLKVPYGSVISYGELAAKADFPRAARAVGGVMASNPFPLIVPCHRVVNADGRIGHYSAAHGTSTKIWLIEFESRNASI